MTIILAYTFIRLIHIYSCYTPINRRRPCLSTQLKDIQSSTIASEDKLDRTPRSQTRDKSKSLKDY